MATPTSATNADLQRLLRANSFEVAEALSRILDRGEALEEAAEIVAARLREGTPIATSYLEDLIAKTHHAETYLLAREQLGRDIWPLVTLYRSLYPDPTIEERLTNELYERATDDGDPARREIVNAIRDVGTPQTLSTLEALLYELVPTRGTKKAIADALFSSSGPSLESIYAGRVAEARASFLDAIVEASRAVRERQPEDMNQVGGAERNETFSEIVVRNAHDELARAAEQVDKDPVLAVVCLRRGAEAMGKHLYRARGLEKKGKPAKKMMLDELLRAIKDTDVPDVFKLALQALQPFGNYAAHDQDDRFADLNDVVARALMTIYGEGLRVYEEWFHNSGESE